MRLAISIVCLLGLAAPTFAQAEVEFPTPKGWEQVPSPSKLRFAQYRPRGKTGPMLVIFRFDGHGEVETVTNRWLSRIEQPDGSSTREAAILQRWTRGSMVLHLVDAKGTRMPSKGHARKGSATEARPGWRLLAGVLVGPGGPYFIRLEGAQAELRDLSDGFFELAFGARSKGASKGAPAPVHAKGLVFRPGPGWEVLKTTSRMRAAEFRLPLAGDSSLELVVYHFGQGGGGPVKDTLKRWISQFTLPDGSPAEGAAKITNKTLPKGVRLTVLDVKGTFVTRGSGSSKAVNRPGQRMLAAIVECPSGPFFVKVVGAEKDVSSQEDSIRRFLDQLTPQP